MRSGLVCRCCVALLLLLASVAGSASGAWIRNAPPCSAALLPRWPNSAQGSIMWPEGAYVQSSRCVPGGKCASRS
eukprot:11476929-Alexandrium_andersonii.AAC.1